MSDPVIMLTERLIERLVRSERPAVRALTIHQVVQVAQELAVGTGPLVDDRSEHPLKGLAYALGRSAEALGGCEGSRQVGASRVHVMATCHDALKATLDRLDAEARLIVYGEEPRG